MNPTLILQCRAPGLFIAKMIFLEMFSALRKSGLLRHVTSRHVTSRHVTFCDSQFIQQQEDTQWVLRTTMGEFFESCFGGDWEGFRPLVLGVLAIERQL